MTAKTEFFAHMEAIVADADAHDKECDEAHEGTCISNRWFLAALFINRLNLSLQDLGHIAEAWLDLQFDCDEAAATAFFETAAADDILNAKEIGE